jgi:hypothetical protein
MVLNPEPHGKFQVIARLFTVTVVENEDIVGVNYGGISSREMLKPPWLHQVIAKGYR